MVVAALVGKLARLVAKHVAQGGWPTTHGANVMPNP